MTHLTTEDIERLITDVNSAVSVATAAKMTSGTPIDWANGSVTPDEHEMDRLVFLRTIVDLLKHSKGLTATRHWLDTHRLIIQHDVLTVCEAIRDGRFTEVKAAAQERARQTG